MYEIAECLEPPGTTSPDGPCPALLSLPSYWLNAQKPISAAAWAISLCSSNTAVGSISRLPATHPSYLRPQVPDAWTYALLHLHAIKDISYLLVVV